MVKVRWDGKTRLPPAQTIPFFRDNPERFVALQCEGTVEVPESLADSLQGLVRDSQMDWERPSSVTEKRLIPQRIFEPYEGE